MLDIGSHELIYTSEIIGDTILPTRIYAFDLDNTLVYDSGVSTTQSAKYNKGIGVIPNWIINGIKSLDGKIVIFSNQLGISTGKCLLGTIQSRINLIKNATGINPHVFIATHDDKYRKPHVGMFKQFMRKYVRTGNPSNTNDSGIKPIIVFCGDAAGRVYDHSDSDRKFALNCGIDFVTPEVFFKRRFVTDCLEKYVLGGYDPSTFMPAPATGPLWLRMREMIIMVGPPSCGKSTYVRNNLQSYIRINQDTLKTRSKCLSQTTDWVKSGLSVVIDNTNPSASVRKLYVDIARKYNYNVRCIFMNVTIELAMHLMSCRTAVCGKVIPAVAYARYLASFEHPSNKEGFSQIINAVFTPSFTKKQLKIFMRRYK
jgi:bifunctional polynucleotide phosphatase/kinase